jgi:hypothetical protein
VLARIRTDKHNTTPSSDFPEGRQIVPETEHKDSRVVETRFKSHLCGGGETF